MLKEGIGGFCMALADSVPGVSGGTVAFIMGFYDSFISAIHHLVFGKRKEKRAAITYLFKLGIGWIIGMVLAILILSVLFESHIYTVSSLFIGFIAGSIPLVIKEEKASFCEVRKGILFCFVGIVLVAGITWLNGNVGKTSMDLSHFSIGLGLKLFLIGMIAISAMFLPGISGSTLLLIFGAYIPVISAIREFLRLNFTYLPCLIFFGFGILIGAATIVKGIKFCLEQYRPQTVYMILGMMLASFYAIIQGPSTLDLPKEAMNLGNFQLLPCLIGATLLVSMQKMKEVNEK